VTRQHHRVRLGGCGHASSAGTAACHPTAAYWLNLVEAFFSITRQAYAAAAPPLSPTSPPPSGGFVDALNDRCRPFTWTKDPDTVIAKATDPRHRKTQTTSDTER
jgi:hypothetical protein